MFTNTAAAPSILAIGGSRRLSPAGTETARLISSALVGSGYGLAVGCATGADAAVIASAAQAGAGSRLRIFTAFGPVTGSASTFAVAGSGSCSASATVAAAGRAGARVTAWAGGGPGLPFPVRLSNRTRAVARAASLGGVVICEGPPGNGSGLLIRSLAGRGLPVWLFPVGWVGGYALPVNGPWSWGWHPFNLSLPCWYLPGQATQGALPMAA